jgi:hypothetical protein
VSWGKRRPERVKRRKELEKSIWAFWEAQQQNDPGEAQRIKKSVTRRLNRLQPQGRIHDLQALFDRINHEYFDNKLDAKVTWSSRWGGLSTHSKRPDGKGGIFHLITISQGYDHPSATPEIIGGVMFHECLHIAIPPQIRQGRRIVHGSDFRRCEKTYAHYEAWMRWHRESLPKILRRGPHRT